MKKEELFALLGNMNEKYISEASRPFKKRHVHLAVPLLLSFAVLIVFFFRGFSFSKRQEPLPSSVEPVSYTAEYPPAAGKTMSAQDFLFSQDYFEWQEAYSQAVGTSTAFQEQLQPFYQAVFANLLKNKTDNAVCAPLNIYIALSVLAEVTAGQSQAQILDALGTDAASLRTISQALWESNYARTPLLTSVLANSFWLNDSVSYREEKLNELMNEYYVSSFAGKPGSDEMNRALREWTSEATGGMMKEETGEMFLAPETVFSLVSAIYYKAMWTDAFDPALTDSDLFYGRDSTDPVIMMHQVNEMPVSTHEDFSSVSLSLGDSGAMKIFLPAEGADVNDLLENEEVLQEIRQESSYVPQVNLSLPKFSAGMQSDLLETMQAMGIRDVTETGRADFSPLVNEERTFHLSKAEHSAVVAVDEEGVCGAAYTEMDVMEGIAEAGEQIDFTVNRPFFFVITGRDGSVLFAGVIHNLSAS